MSFLGRFFNDDDGGGRATTTNDQREEKEAPDGHGQRSADQQRIGESS
jgi:hypothetical protein